MIGGGLAKMNEEARKANSFAAVQILAIESKRDKDASAKLLAQLAKRDRQRRLTGLPIVPPL